MVSGNMASFRGIWRQLYTRDSDNIEAEGAPQRKPSESYFALDVATQYLFDIFLMQYNIVLYFV